MENIPKPESNESGKAETNSTTIANFLMEKYGFETLPTQLEGTMLNLQKEDCSIEIAFNGYRRVADIRVETGDDALIEQIRDDLEKTFDFIDQETGTINKGHIRILGPR